MRRFQTLVLVGALASVLQAGAGVAAADEGTPAKPPETTAVRLGPLGAPIEAKGTLEPLRFETVACEPEVYGGPFEIVERAGEGPVVKGQVLVRFDEKPYLEQLAEKERSLETARYHLERQERTAALTKRGAALQMEEKVRRKRLADEELERFLGYERRAREEEMTLAFKNAQDGIKDQQEELEQLEKMYSADDLTEETEEIVLNRARRALEKSLKAFAIQKNRYDYEMKVKLPRELERLRLRVRRYTNDLEMLQTTAPMDAAQAERNLVKARLDFEKQEESLSKFRADRDCLGLKAPSGGYAVAGTLSGGRWSGLGQAQTNLKKGAKVKARQVLFTVVDDSVLRVRTSVTEKDLLAVKTGGMATVTCALTGKAKFEAKVEQVARYGSDGKYEVLLRVLTKDRRLRAGLACEVGIVTDSGEEVLSIPASCLQEENGDSFVYVSAEDGEPTKTAVKLGRRSDGRVEVTEGLRAGQKILLHPPKAESADKPVSKK